MRHGLDDFSRVEQKTGMHRKSVMMSGRDERVTADVEGIDMFDWTPNS